MSLRWRCSSTPDRCRPASCEPISLPERSDHSQKEGFEVHHVLHSGCVVWGSRLGDDSAYRHPPTKGPDSRSCYRACLQRSRNAHWLRLHAQQVRYRGSLAMITLLQPYFLQSLRKYPSASTEPNPLLPLTRHPRKPEIPVLASFLAAKRLKTAKGHGRFHLSSGRAN